MRMGRDAALRISRLARSLKAEKSSATNLLLSSGRAQTTTAFATPGQGRGRRQGDGTRRERKVADAGWLIDEASAEDRVRPTRPVACYPDRHTGGVSHEADRGKGQIS